MTKLSGWVDEKEEIYESKITWIYNPCTSDAEDLLGKINGRCVDVAYDVSDDSWTILYDSHIIRAGFSSRENAKQYAEKNNLVRELLRVR